jgi:hypothetical protein
MSHIIAAFLMAVVVAGSASLATATSTLTETTLEKRNVDLIAGTMTDAPSAGPMSTSAFPSSSRAASSW